MKLLPGGLSICHPYIWSSTNAGVARSAIQDLLQALGLLHLEQAHVQVDAELADLVPATLRGPG